MFDVIHAPRCVGEYSGTTEAKNNETKLCQLSRLAGVFGLAFWLAVPVIAIAEDHGSLGDEEVSYACFPDRVLADERNVTNLKLCLYGTLDIGSAGFLPGFNKHATALIGACNRVHGLGSTSELRSADLTSDGRHVDEPATGCASTLHCVLACRRAESRLDRWLGDLKLFAACVAFSLDRFSFASR